MSGKQHVNISIDADIVKAAKERGFNISEEAEFALSKKINQESIIIDEAIFPKELAESDPEHYWINNDGDCKRRGKPTYWINENGVVTQTSKENYDFWYKYYVKEKYTTLETEKPKDEDDGINSALSDPYIMNENRQP